MLGCRVVVGGWRVEDVITEGLIMGEMEMAEYCSGGGAIQGYQV